MLVDEPGDLIAIGVGRPADLRRSRRSASGLSAGSRGVTVGASAQETSLNRKLAPVTERRSKGRLQLKAAGPFVSSTYVSIASTCPSSCRFKDNGCFAQTGFTGFTVRLLDGADRSGEEVATDEAAAIDRMFPGGVPQDGGRDGNGGRDLRLHVSGDVADEASAVKLAGAARRWMARGGGTVWTYTHRWSEISASAWGPVQALASVESVMHAGQAQKRGYVAALVLRRFEQKKAYRLPRLEGRVVPCPAETGAATCVQCRLCLNTDRLKKLGITIGFETHGTKKAASKLPRFKVPEDRKTEKVCVTMSRKDFDLLASAAKERGYNLSEFLRSSAARVARGIKEERPAQQKLRLIEAALTAPYAWDERVELALKVLAR